jgi:predicted phosphodiesterase
MSVLPRSPIIVVADLHLAASRGGAAAEPIAAVLDRHPGAELVCAGDSFDLSVEATPDQASRTLATILGAHRRVRELLRRRLIGGSRVTLIAGNHDAALVTESVQAALTSSLELLAEAPLAISPWFVRRGRVHIEHGHVHDPDNAPVHPLARWRSECEPLGIALTRRVLAPTDALELTHAHETTPLAGLRRTLGLLGLPGLAVIARYFGVSASLCWEAVTRGDCGVEREQAAQALGPFVEASGLDSATIEKLIQAAPTPTHRHLVRTFRRLYLDRASAAAVLLGAGSAALVAPTPPAWTVAALAMSYLSLSVWFEGTNRYAGALEARLREAARIVADLSDARLVVFGHAHREDAAERYLNPGAFGLPRDAGPRYVLIGEDGTGACLNAQGA